MKIKSNFDKRKQINADIEMIIKDYDCVAKAADLNKIPEEVRFTALTKFVKDNKDKIKIKDENINGDYEK